MKLKLNFDGIALNNQGRPIAMFAITNNESMTALTALEKKECIVEINEQKRTLSQNALLWELIGQIDKAMNGSRVDDEKIYCQILQMAKANVEYVECIEPAIDTLKRLFRVVTVVQHRNREGKHTVVCACLIGTSQMTNNEMCSVIDTALHYAAENGINIDLWKDRFEETRKKEEKQNG